MKTRNCPSLPFVLVMGMALTGALSSGCSSFAAGASLQSKTRYTAQGNPILAECIQTITGGKDKHSTLNIKVIGITATENPNRLAQIIVEGNYPTDAEYAAVLGQGGLAVKSLASSDRTESGRKYEAWTWVQEGNKTPVQDKTIRSNNIYRHYIDINLGNKRHVLFIYGARRTVDHLYGSVTRSGEPLEQVAVSDMATPLYSKGGVGGGEKGKNGCQFQHGMEELFGIPQG